MLKRIKSFLAALSLSLALAVPVLAPVTVRAADEISGNLCAGAEIDASQLGNSGECQVDSGEAENKVNDIIKLVINIFSLIVGVVSVIMIIIGGLKYITSGGDSGNITGAKNTILYAIIGLVVVALAQVVVRFVLAKTITNT